ncbi:MAG: YraN family protein [Solirubrobacteraceae bacterium]
MKAPLERGGAQPPPNIRDERRAIGARGEDLACEHLERRGFAILARNVRTRGGEIDVVAFDGVALVFAEVKTLRVAHPGIRTERRPGAPTTVPRIGPLDGLRFSQRHRIRGLATAWLAARPPFRAREIRFDAIGVTIDLAGALLELEHLEAAW